MEAVQRTPGREAIGSTGRASGVKVIGRSALAIVAGALVAMVLIGVVEGVSSALYPPPADLDLNNPEALRQYIDRLPIGAFLLLLAGWAAGTFSGAWVGARLARRAGLLHGLVVGALFLLAGVASMLMIPHPLWMWVAAIGVFVGGSYLGARLGGRPAS